MTVGELVAILAAFPPDMPVEIEGCDCINAAKDVVAPEPSNWFPERRVLITADLMHP